MKRSENIKAFLDFLKQSETDYKAAYAAVNTEDKRGQDLLHAIEFEASYRERNKLTTKLRNSRIERRENKDIVEELQPVMDFIQDPRHKKTLDMLQQLLGAVRKEENYHRNRAYLPRVEKQEGRKK